MVEDQVERDGEVLWLWVLVLTQVKHGMMALSPPLELLEPWKHVPLWAPLSPLELPHRNFGGNASLWVGARKVGEVRVVVVDRAGVEWLRIEKFRPVVGAPPFVVPQYGNRGKLVPGVGEH